MPTDSPDDSANGSNNAPENDPENVPDEDPGDRREGDPQNVAPGPPTVGGGAEPQPGAETASVLPLPSWWSFVAIGVMMLVVLAVVSQGAKFYFQWRAGALTSQFVLAPPAPATPLPNGSPAPTTTAEIARAIPSECKAVKDKESQDHILKQRAQAVEFGDGHRNAAIEFGSYFFANVAILGIFGLISLISVAVIAKTGLDKANGHVVAIFLLASGTGLLYQSFFGVFQQKQNVESNLTQAIVYAQLVSKIDTYCTTGRVVISDPKTFLDYRVKQPSTAPPETDKPKTADESADQTKPVEPAAFFLELDPPTFILFIDWHLEDRRKFAIAFDDKLVPSLTDPNRLSLKDF
ncbi:MAG: hypothetical protein ABI857_06475 [Acidobacteriota bacterium]